MVLCFWWCLQSLPKFSSKSPPTRGDLKDHPHYPGLLWNSFPCRVGHDPCPLKCEASLLSNPSDFYFPGLGYLALTLPHFPSPGPNWFLWFQSPETQPLSLICFVFLSHFISCLLSSIFHSWRQFWTWNQSCYQSCGLAPQPLSQSKPPERITWTLSCLTHVPKPLSPSSYHSAARRVVLEDGSMGLSLSLHPKRQTASSFCPSTGKWLVLSILGLSQLHVGGPSSYVSPPAAQGLIFC